MKEEREQKKLSLLLPSQPSELDPPLFNKSFICPFCTSEFKYIKAINVDEIEEHLIVTKDESGHIHVHGPVHNKEIMKEFIKAIAKESEMEIV